METLTEGFRVINRGEPGIKWKYLHWPQGPGTQGLMLKVMHLTAALYEAATLQLFPALPINQCVKKV